MIRNSTVTMYRAPAGHSTEYLPELASAPNPIPDDTDAPATHRRAHSSKGNTNEICQSYLF